MSPEERSRRRCEEEEGLTNDRLRGFLRLTALGPVQVCLETGLCLRGASFPCRAPRPLLVFGRRCSAPCCELRPWAPLGLVTLSPVPSVPAPSRLPPDSQQHFTAGQARIPTAHPFRLGDLPLRTLTPKLSLQGKGDAEWFGRCVTVQYAGVTEQNSRGRGLYF